MIYIILLLLSLVCFQAYKIKKINIEPQIEQPDYQMIIVHTRATDRVFFGPFKNMTEIKHWYSTNPETEKVYPSTQILISPHANPDEWWYIPLDHPEDLTESQSAIFQ